MSWFFKSSPPSPLKAANDKIKKINQLLQELNNDELLRLIDAAKGDTAMSPVMLNSDEYCELKNGLTVARKGCYESRGMLETLAETLTDKTRSHSGRSQYGGSNSHSYPSQHHSYTGSQGYSHRQSVAPTPPPPPPPKTVPLKILLVLSGTMHWIPSLVDRIEHALVVPSQYSKTHELKVSIEQVSFSDIKGMPPSPERYSIVFYVHRVDGRIDVHEFTEALTRLQSYSDNVVFMAAVNTNDQHVFKVHDHILANYPSGLFLNTAEPIKKYISLNAWQERVISEGNLSELNDIFEKVILRLIASNV